MGEQSARMEVISKVWNYYSINERFALIIAFLWISLWASFEVWDGNGLWFLVIVLIMISLGICAIGSFVAMFGEGGGFEKRWRRVIDRLLPVTTLFGTFYILTSLPKIS